MQNNTRPTVAVLLTCHNRRETTLRTLKSVQAAVQDSCHPRIVLVDDGSRDGTAEAVKQAYPDAVVRSGDGQLYWNGGMRLAWEVASAGQPDFYLWLNDDTQLRPNAIKDLLERYERAARSRTIIVGRTVDPASKETTYGGYRHANGVSKIRFRRLTSNEERCHTMNGNCVLIPGMALGEVGGMRSQYRHAFGDNDYGLRATKCGYDLLELKEPIAEQERNFAYHEAVRTLTLKNWRFILFHPKGVPVREWFFFCKTHGGWLWPVNFAVRYLKMVWR
ncbi:glycosyltransferase family 2 protein [Bradyrhizobium sp. WSM1253]|uniref:glycosyltransferase family 2 protein n=1 Tax=Bradyrhizobium sp. WSM1253 TaxID=319003 RepID=UPI00025D209E|nr:glycosyltransferase family 2 protein [Bradyrhizobium sp. WSM1253]EIG58455.1 putative glycosyltransferase [Bradyrhizobium sp. WSM1253]